MRFGEACMPRMRRTRLLTTRKLCGTFGRKATVSPASEAWLIDYNQCRPHGSLGHLTPNKFAEARHRGRVLEGHREHRGRPRPIRIHQGPRRPVRLQGPSLRNVAMTPPYFRDGSV